jgi:precorrin-6B methylase 2
MNFYTGLSRASTIERSAMLHMERRAIAEACQQEYLRRLDATGSIILDAADLEPTAVTLKWARSKGYLYVIYRVYHRDTLSITEFRWRCKPRLLAEKEYKTMQR